MIGDAFCDFCERMRYTVPTSDSNRARWPLHPLWQQVVETVAKDLRGYRAGVLPRDVREVDRLAHMQMLDRMALGLIVSRAAASDVTAEAFGDFLTTHVQALQRLSDEHPVPVDKRLSKAALRYRFK